MEENEFLLALKDWIGNAAYEIDAEWGESRSIDMLIAEDAMPPVYAEVLRRIERLEAASALGLGDTQKL